MFLSTKFSTKKFHLVSKYANYPTWDEKQNAPFFIYFFNSAWAAANLAIGTLYGEHET